MTDSSIFPRPEMQQFLYGHSNGKSVDQLLADCLSQIGTVPAQANLGFVYATDALSESLASIVAELKQQTHVDHWAGTVGLGINNMGREYYDEPALVIMIASFPESSFKIIPSQRSDIDDFIHSCGNWLQQDSVYFGILHADPGSTDAHAVLQALTMHIPNAFFVGGLTSSKNGNPQIADDITTGGLSGVLFDSDVPVVTGHTQGCTPIADKHIITACEQNIIIELDGKPALDVFKEDAGEVIARDLQRMVGYIFAGFPIPGSDTGDYLVRNLIGVDLDRKLIAVSELLHEGDQIMICRRDGNTAQADMRRMLIDIKSRMTDTPRGAVYYSCTARGRHQFGENSEELKLIRDELGDFPLVGFFANGEIFHNRLYGYTGVLTVFI